MGLRKRKVAKTLEEADEFITTFKRILDQADVTYEFNVVQKTRGSEIVITFELYGDEE